MKRSPTLTWDQLRVGLLILLAIGVIAVAIYKLGDHHKHAYAQESPLPFQTEFSARHRLVVHVSDFTVGR